MFFSKFVAACMTDKQCKGDERCEDFECKKPSKTTILANPNYFRISESVCPCERGERGLLKSILACYKPLASQNPPTPILAYSLLWANLILAIPTQSLSVNASTLWSLFRRWFLNELTSCKLTHKIPKKKPKIQPFYNQSSREKVTLSIDTSPLGY